MNDKQNKVLEKKLVYATNFLKAIYPQEHPLVVLQKALLIMDFGGISVQDMIDYLEATL